MKKFISSFLLITSFIIFSSSAYSQDDCLGMGSVSRFMFGGLNAGYGFQQFSAEGLNHYISVYNLNRPNLTQKMDEFGNAKGFWFGLSPFKIAIINWAVGLKFSYSILNETNEAVGTVSGETATREYELKLKTFQVILAFEYYLSENFAFKVADIGITFTSADFYNRLNQTGEQEVEQKLTSVDNTLGVNIAAGLIISIVPEFISIEGTVGYSYFYINEMEFDNGVLLQEDENSTDEMFNFINSGGIFAFISLNIGIPSD